MRKFTFPALFVAFAAGVSVLVAQDGPSSSTTVQSPPPPPPAAAIPAQPAEQVVVDGLIVVEKLPSSAQLLNDAEAEKMTILRMQQSADRVVVTYQYASGATRTFAYTTTLPSDPEPEGSTASVVSTPPPSSPNYTVVYSEPAPVYYSYPRYYSSRYYTPGYYDPFGPSLSIGLGFGRSYGGYYGNYGNSRYSGRGGYHGNYRGRHR